MAVRCLRVMLGSLLLILTGGCWDADSIEQLDYVKALGIDFAEGQYVVYLHLPNLSNVAKKEGPTPEEPSKAWLGTGRGNSINEAIGQIYRSSPKKIIWGHTTILVLSERMLQRPELPDVLEDLNRFRELRYTMWVYGTKSSIPELFAVSPTFEASRLYTIMHNPMDNYKMASFVLPLRLHDFMYGYQDPGNWARIPALSIDTKNWEAGEEPHQMQAIDGVFAFHLEKYAGFYPMDKIMGMRWLDFHTIKSALRIMDGKKTVAVLSIEDPRYAVTLNRQGDKVTFDIKLKLFATLTELHETLGEKQLVEQGKKLAEEQLRSTFLAGVKNKTDLLQLSKHMYRKHAKAYNQMTENGENLLLTPDSLGRIDVDIDLEFLGKYKFVE